ncbi:MAG: HAD family acid phosphatase [Pseudomonadota bacterium]|uniref:HAD family acid phosphatase n=1 Tax=Sphingobium TaxID=165695 RepID=UPI00031A89C0|nr:MULTISPECIES: HAD family acid phosphatase [Sphingobium]OUC53739.1 hypothetical protein CA262_01795 [Sphingobium sp. GW456-12-10-14-TSB1]QWT15778.1 hypothetical protein GTV57_04770 [Sphingobium xenophagum]
MRRLTGALAAAAALLAGAPATAQTRPDSDQPWREFQWLYGSAEGAATSRQAFNALRAFAVIQAERWRMGEPVVQRVLAPGATLDRPAFESCGDKKPAVVFDIDETLLLNTGAEYWAAAKQQSYEQSRAFDKDAWAKWEKDGAKLVDPVPGAVEAVDTLRKADIAVIFNSNRSASSMQETAEALAHAGLGVAEPGKTLFLDSAGDGKKDGRRATIAETWCVVAMAGDQLGDFSDLFNVKENGRLPVVKRRQAMGSPMLARMWGQGWFLLPNPVYGKGAEGDFNEIFPKNRWKPH